MNSNYQKDSDFWRNTWLQENDAVTDWVWKSHIGILYIRVHDVEEQSKFKISSTYLSSVEINVSKNKWGETYHLKF